MASPDPKKSGKPKTQGKAKAKTAKTVEKKTPKDGGKKTATGLRLSPLKILEKKHQSRESLIKEINGLTAKKDLLVEKFGGKGIEGVSNSKLMRLHRIITEVTAKFPTRAALVDEIVSLQGRSKDATYKNKLAAYTLGRLWDIYRMNARKAARKARALAKAGKKA